MALEIVRRIVDGIWTTDVADAASGGSLPEPTEGEARKLLRVSDAEDGSQAEPGWRTSEDGGLEFLAADGETVMAHIKAVGDSGSELSMFDAGGTRRVRAAYFQNGLSEISLRNANGDTRASMTVGSEGGLTIS